MGNATTKNKTTIQKEVGEPMRLYYGGHLLYESQPRQSAFHNNDAQCRMYGGAAGGGKTEAILWEAFAISNNPKYKKLKGAIFRKTFPEIDKYFIQRALDKFPKALYKYSEKKHIMTFLRTGSTIEFCFCDSDLDVSKYQGAEWDWLAIDEFTHHTEFVFKYLFTRCRTNKKDWIPMFFGGTNPGGVGHGWVKRIWIDEDLVDIEDNFTWAFIPARLEDNPKMLEENPMYESQLMMLPDPVIREAMRNGNWDIFAGQYFTEIRPDIHGFDPFPIPTHWAKFLEIDYGFDHPAICHWNAVDEDGHIWKYKEYVCRGKTYREFAQQIVDMTTDDEKIEYAVADPSIWAKKGSSGGMSGAEEMQEVFDEKKIMIMPADNDRINGWGIMREYVKVYTGKDGKKTAKMHIAKSMKFWWKHVLQLQRDPKKPEDVLKATTTNSEGVISYSDDSADATRYGLMSRPRPGKPKAPMAKNDRYGYKEKKQPTIVQGRPEWKPAGGAPKWQGNIPR